MPQLGAGEVRALVRCYRDALRTHAGALDRLNVFPVPDGDTGTNLLRTMDAVVEALPPEGADPAATCRAVADGALLGARGNSGVILSQVLRAMTRALAEGADVDEALRAAATAARRAVHEPVEGTVLTVADAAEPDVDDLTERLGELGDSVAVGGADGRWSCHVHTDDPDAAVAAGHDAGTPSRVEVTDRTA